MLHNREVNSVPQILIGEKLIGGYDDMKKCMEPYFDYEYLHYVTSVVVKNLNLIIDINFYPTDKTRRSNFLHRPIGLGVQGLADVFALLDVPFYSEKARQINKNIFETIYHSAVQTSMHISRNRMECMYALKTTYEKEWEFIDTDVEVVDKINISRQYKLYDNCSEETRKFLNCCKPIKAEILNNDNQFMGSYSSYKDSPISKGYLQFDLWKKSPSERYDWSTLKFDIAQFGVRNSLLVAPMPTASTSQILGNNECFEPFTSNIYVRRTIAGEFIIVNKHLIKELVELGLWNENTKNTIIANNGSIQSLDVSEHIKEKYRTVWGDSMKHLLQMSAEELLIFVNHRV